VLQSKIHFPLYKKVLLLAHNVQKFGSAPNVQFPLMQELSHNEQTFVAFGTNLIK